MIQAVYQNPRNLTLGVVAGLHDLPLTVLKQETLVTDAWKVRFCIIGESHFVEVLRDNVPILSELLACVDISPRLCFHHHRFGDLITHRFRQPGYEVSVDFEQFERGDLEDDIRGIMGGRLEMQFPRIHGQTPITRIEWANVAGSKIEWRTLHIYPQRKRGWRVRSLSVFDGLNYNKTP